MHCNFSLFVSSFVSFWPKGYQRGSLWKSHQNGDYLIQAMRKSYPPTEFEPAASGYPDTDPLLYHLSQRGRLLARLILAIQTQQIAFAMMLIKN